jgi:hypothetical protein
LVIRPTMGWSAAVAVKLAVARATAEIERARVRMFNMEVLLRGVVRPLSDDICVPTVASI